MKKTLALTLAAAMTLSLAACGSSASSASSAATSTESTSTDTSAATSTAAESGTVENKDKPLVWFNRQPSNSTTGELDTEALNFNGNTYYVGFDANQGAELQGKMIADYIKAHADTIDRTATALSAMFWQSAISAIMTRLPVPVAFVALWAPQWKAAAALFLILSVPMRMVPLPRFRTAPLMWMARLSPFVSLLLRK